MSNTQGPIYNITKPIPQTITMGILGFLISISLEENKISDCFLFVGHITSIFYTAIDRHFYGYAACPPSTYRTPLMFADKYFFTNSVLQNW